MQMREQPARFCDLHPAKQKAFTLTYLHPELSDFTLTDSSPGSRPLYHQHNPQRTKDRGQRCSSSSSNAVESFPFHSDSVDVFFSRTSNFDYFCSHSVSQYQQSTIISGGHSLLTILAKVLQVCTPLALSLKRWASMGSGSGGAPFTITAYGISQPMVNVTTVTRFLLLGSQRNVSLIDFCYISITVPKSTLNSFTNVNSISLPACAAQMFLVIFLVGLQIALLTVMSHDRSVAICSPRAMTSSCTAELSLRLTCSASYIAEQSISDTPSALDLVSVLYAVVSPTLNPLIYSLRTWNIKAAMSKLLGKERFGKEKLCQVNFSAS
ncbi:olfactory receptor 10R2-like [Tachyglossus aculeatus]|uniref:olfactory receptor 10R2-like n=1 Tax=Tachyglossus aculeatus TaxID=9261 RepID=UPI0018F5F69B|nr:olfactory receptor 10R2-like [Tachyglossus aculeatus]